MHCPFTLTVSAKEHIKYMLAKEPGLSMFKLSVLENKGCFGLKFLPSLEQNKQEDDFLFEYEGLKILVPQNTVDKKYAHGLLIDCKKESMGQKKLVYIHKDRKTESCGCGESFSLED